MACNCINEIDEKLDSEHRLRLDTAISLRSDAFVERTYSRLIRRDNGRTESRSGKPSIFAHTFCPFCGVRIDPESARPQED